MSAAESSWGAAGGARVRPTVVVAGAAALVALGSGGQGLLVPAGPTSTMVRVVGAVVSLTAVGVLVRVDGPAIAARTLVVVACAGAAAALVTLPFSPVHLSEPSVTAGAPMSAPTGDGDDAGGSVVLDRVAPEGVNGSAGVLVLPGGSTVVLDGGDVVLRLGDGSSVVLGRAATPADPPAPGTPAEGSRPAVVVTAGGVTRSDGGPIGGDTLLGGVVLEGADGRRVVVGDGVLLDVPAPIPSEVERPGDAFAEGSDALLAVLLACFALLAFAPPIVRVAERSMASRAVPEPAPRPAPGGHDEVEEGLAAVLRAMLADPDPRTAVIGAYAGLLAALAEVGHRRWPQETPHEHLWRVLGPLGVRRAPVHRLAELFVRARFTPRPVTAEHREAAVAALADAVADLRLSSEDVEEARAGSGTSGTVGAAVAERVATS